MTKAQDNLGHFRQIPKEILPTILEFLNERELCRLSQV